MRNGISKSTEHRLWSRTSTLERSPFHHRGQGRVEERELILSSRHLRHLTEVIESLDEGFDIEFKQAGGRDGTGLLPGSFWESYSAMANSSGGKVFLGIKEKGGKLLVSGVPQPEKLIKSLFDELNNRDKVSINLLSNHDVEITKFGERRVIVVSIPRATRTQRPVFIGTNPLTGTYRRNHEGDYLCESETVRRLMADAVEEDGDAKILEGYGQKDLNESTILNFKRAFLMSKPTHPWLEEEGTEFLAAIGAYRVDRQTRACGLTVAGLLMFGKLRAIMDRFPHYLLDYQEQTHDEDTRWIDRLTTDGSWSGNLFDFFRLVYPKLISDLKVPFRLKEGVRVDESHVHEALREAFVNCLVHADYSARVGIKIIKRPDGFTFRNPGGLRIPLETIIQGGVSDCRNRNLMKLFQLAGLGEQAGSGVPKIRRAWREQDWQMPELEEDLPNELTILSLPKVSLVSPEVLDELAARFGKEFSTLNQLERLAVITACTRGYVTNRFLRSVTAEHSVDITKVLRSLVERKFLSRKGSGRGSQYTLPDSETNIKVEQIIFDLDFDSIESSTHSDPSSTQSTSSSTHSAPSSTHSGSSEIDDSIWSNLMKGGQPLREGRKTKHEVRETILTLCKNRYLSLQQISVLIGRSVGTLRNQYIKELVDKGLLIQKYPTQTHPNQAYKSRLS